MFCSNCGFKVSENDNYCPNCGKKLKNIKVSIINEEAENSKATTSKNLETKLKDETRIFKPIKIDSIDSTNNIKDIIQEVDKKISKNIENYEKNITDDFIGPQEPINKDIPIKENFKEKENNISKSTKLKKPQEQKKKSLVDKFKNFINEDDDEFSIFSSLNQNKEIEEGVEIASASDNTQTNFEDTMGISKAEIEDAIIKSEKQQREKAQEIKNDITKENKENKENKKSLNYKSFTEMVNEQLNKNSENDDVNKKIQAQKDVNNTSKGKNSVKDFFTKEKNKISKKISEIKKEKEDYHKDNKKYNKDKNETVDKKVIEKIEKEILDNEPAIYKYLLKLSSILSNLENKLFKSKHSFEILLVIGIIISIFPIIISLKTISLTLIILSLLKIILRFIEFYLPLHITTNKIWVSTNERELKKYSLINFLICESVLLVCYILSPMYGLFKFYLLGALTSLPVATVILVLLSTSISTSFYLKEIREDNNLLDFVAWYMISFIVIEFISKFIFIFANFLING